MREKQHDFRFGAAVFYNECQETKKEEKYRNIEMSMEKKHWQINSWGQCATLSWVKVKVMSQMSHLRASLAIS